MRILIYCDDPCYGGTAINAGLLAVGISQSGFYVTLVASKNPIPGNRTIGFVPLDYDTCKCLYKTMYSRNEPEAVLMAIRPELVFFCDGSPDSSLAAKSVCRDWGVPYAVMVNYVTAGLAEAMGEQRRKRVVRSLHDALAVIAVSKENLIRLCEDFAAPPQRSRVIYNGRPSEWFQLPPPGQRGALRQKLGLTSSDVLFLTVARYEPRKGYRYLLAGIRNLVGVSLPTRLFFVWIGQSVDGGAVNLRAAADAAGLGDRVMVVGERDDVRAWMAAADAFMLPSESEGMPLCLIEAMAQGLPVIATSVSGIPEEIGEAGILLPDPRHQPEAMVAAMVKAINELSISPERRRSLGAAGRQRALKLFTAEDMIAAYTSLLQSLAPMVRSARPRWPNPSTYRSPLLATVGRDILLGEDECCIEFLKEGWSHAESTGRWTDGPRARITLALPPELECGFILIIEACPFLGHGDRIVKVAIRINGQDMGHTVWADSNEVRRMDFAVFWVGMSVQRAEIELLIDGASSPAEHGLSDDGRQLGLRISRLRLERLIRRRQ